MSDLIVENSAVSSIYVKKYSCPVHGVHDNRMVFHPAGIMEREVSFCTACLANQLIAIGVSEMVEVES